MRRDLACLCAKELRATTTSRRTREEDINEPRSKSLRSYLPEQVKELQCLHQHRCGTQDSIRRQNNPNPRSHPEYDDEEEEENYQLWRGYGYLWRERQW